MPNLLEFTEIIYKWVDEESPVDAIYLDFQKAFDKVPHQRLFIKLRAHAMGDSTVNWVNNWLTGRKQRVAVEGGSARISAAPYFLFFIFINYYLM